MQKGLLTREQVIRYLARIKCSFEAEPSLRYLTKLHRQHIYSIPFENLDNFIGNQVLLDIKKIFEKVVIRRRGGFCFELNGLFHQLLVGLGYQVELVSARVFHDQNKIGPEFDHMAIVAMVEGQRYLLDVGYGESFRSPKAIVPGLVQMDYQEYFKIVKNIDENFTLSYSADCINYSNQYIFDLMPRRLIEFVDMCDFHHRNKASHLVKKIYIHQTTTTGQMILTNRQLTIEENGVKSKYAVHNKEEFMVLLSQHFGLRPKRNA